MPALTTPPYSTQADMNLRHVFIVGVALLACAGSVHAQTTTGTVRGYVKDQSGAPLAGAEVQAKNIESGVTRSTTTRADGAYILPGIVPGTYDVVVRMIGFAPQGRRMAVQIGATLLADFALQAGAVELTAVTVQAENPVLEPRPSEAGPNVTH